MSKNLKLIKNKAGRMVPEMVNGVKSIPFKGVGKHSPNGVKAAPPIRACQDYPASGNKVVSSLKEALEKCNISYTPEGGNFKTFEDNAPVAYQMDLTFVELEFMTKATIAKGM